MFALIKQRASRVALLKLNQSGIGKKEEEVVLHKEKNDVHKRVMLCESDEKAVIKSTGTAEKAITTACTTVFNSKLTKKYKSNAVQCV